MTWPQLSVYKIGIYQTRPSITYGGSQGGLLKRNVFKGLYHHLFRQI